MKTVFASLLILIGTSALAQNEQKVWFNTGFTANYMQTEHVIDAEIPKTFTVQDDQERDQWDTFALGLKTQLGYTINDRWSAGAQVGVAITVGWYYFIPKFKAIPQFGLFGQYHFSDKFGLIAQANYTRLQLGRDGISMGLAPQIGIGKRDNILLRFSAEYFYGRETINFRVAGQDELGNDIDYVQSAPRISRGMLLEVGLMFKMK